ncbi:hypothetical protein C8R43DRAFT_903057, partial [Mycena crocata]
MLGPDEEAILWDARKSQSLVYVTASHCSLRKGNSILTEKDRDNIRGFKLKMMSQMPRTAYNQMVYTFDHKMDLSTEWVMLHRVAILSGIQPVWYHCCVNSCAAYTGRFSDLTECEYCDEPRLSPKGKPRRMFCYLPIIPRLQGFFQNPKSIERLLYRANYEHIPDTISDVFDGQHYRDLCDQHVVVDGETLEHKYFSGKYDVCLGVCTDSYLLF